MFVRVLKTYFAFFILSAIAAVGLFACTNGSLISHSLGDSRAFLYVLNNITSNNFFPAYYGDSTSTTSGPLQTGSSYTIGSFGLTAVATDPLGRFFYVSNTQITFNLFAFQITDNSSGATSLSQNLTAGIGGAGITSMVVDPSGQYLYIGTNYISGANLFSFSINQTNGSLTAINNVQVPGNIAVNKITIHPSGNYLYVSTNASAAPKSFFVYLLTNGTIGGSTADNGAGSGNCAPGVTSLANVFDSSTNTLYVGNTNPANNVCTFPVTGGGGTLSGGVTVTAGAASVTALVLSASKNCLLSGNSSGVISSFNVSGGAFITPGITPTYAPSGSPVTTMASAPFGENIYFGTNSAATNFYGFGLDGSCNVSSTFASQSVDASPVTAMGFISIPQ